MQETRGGTWKLGVDVGGTFTDAVLYNEDTGELYKAKVSRVWFFMPSRGNTKHVRRYPALLRIRARAYYMQ